MHVNMCMFVFILPYIYPAVYLCASLSIFINYHSLLLYLFQFLPLFSFFINQTPTSTSVYSLFIYIINLQSKQEQDALKELLKRVPEDFSNVRI